VDKTVSATQNPKATGLQGRKLYGVLEIFLVFAVAAVIIGIGLAFVGEDPFVRQLVVVAANIAMLLLVWLGLRLRRQSIEYLGLAVKFMGWKPVALGFAKSLAVLALGLAGFMLGSIVMANITGIPEQADTSGYNYMQGNLPLLLISLASIYIVSSFGEEVIYRGFLINRLEELFGGGRKAVWAAMIISSLIFGLAHFGWGVVGVVQTTFMGFALAGSYLLFKRNLWILVAAHVYMDTALIVPMYFG
jgi:membrane protease YdiL (CAAX protease family)